MKLFHRFLSTGAAMGALILLGGCSGYDQELKVASGWDAASSEPRRVRVHIDTDRPIQLHRDVSAVGAPTGAPPSGFVCESPCDTDVEVGPGIRYRIEGDITGPTDVALDASRRAATVVVRGGDPVASTTGLVFAAVGEATAVIAGIIALGAAAYDADRNERLAPGQAPYDSFDGPLTPTLATMGIGGLVSFAIGFPIALATQSNVMVLNGVEATGNGLKVRF